MSVSLKKDASMHLYHKALKEVFSAEKETEILPENIVDIICDFTSFSKNLIKNNYDVVFQSKLVDLPENAKLFLLAEEHNNKECNELNARFIQQRAVSGSLLLVEALPAKLGKRVNVKFWIDHYSKAYALDEWFFNTCPMQGWDSDRALEVCEAIHKNKHVQDSLKEQLRCLQDKVVCLLTSKAAFPDKDVQVNLLLKQIRNLEEQIQANDKQMNELAAQSFPERTASMIRTLKKVAHSARENPIFLIAGKGHLVTYQQADPRFCLKGLYKALNTISSVVLVPKIIKNS